MIMGTSWWDHSIKQINGVIIENTVTIDTDNIYRCELSYNDTPLLHVEKDRVFGNERHGFRWGASIDQETFLDTYTDNDSRLGGNPNVRIYNGTEDPKTETYVNFRYQQHHTPERIDVLNDLLEHDHSLAGWDVQNAVNDQHPHEITVYDTNKEQAYKTLRSYLPLTMDSEHGTKVTDALITAAEQTLEKHEEWE